MLHVVPWAWRELSGNGKSRDADHPLWLEAEHHHAVARGRKALEPPARLHSPGGAGGGTDDPVPPLGVAELPAVVVSLQTWSQLSLHLKDKCQCGGRPATGFSGP